MGGWETKVKPLFVTGNAHKAESFHNLLGVDFDHAKLDVDEIQAATGEEVVKRKVRQAYEIARRPVFVDDLSLWFDALDGMPGPFIKYFLGTEEKLEMLCRMADGLPSRRATARAYFGYYDGTTLEIIYGELKGEIANHPKGTAKYAVDSDFVFAVDGYDGRTRAELSKEEYDEVYHKVRAFDKIREFLRGE